MPLPPAPGRASYGHAGELRGSDGRAVALHAVSEAWRRGGTAGQGGEDGRQALKMGRGRGEGGPSLLAPVSAVALTWRVGDRDGRQGAVVAV